MIVMVERLQKPLAIRVPVWVGIGVAIRLRQSKVDDFCKHVDLHLPKDGSLAACATT